LLLIKLFRPKLGNDLWLIHTIGLMEVTLGCVLAGEPLFGLLLLLYLVCALWCLHLFHLYREQQRVAAAQPAGPGAPGAGAPPRTRPRAPTLFGTGRLALGILGVGLLLFLVAPRKGDSHWNPLNLSLPGKVQASVVQGGIDLNSTGRVELSEERAFAVEAHDLQGQTVSLSEGQRWRTETLDLYARGRWRTLLVLPPLQAPPPPVQPGVTRRMRTGQPLLDIALLAPIRYDRSGKVPELGPRQIAYTFSLDPFKAGGLVLADPILGAGPERVLTLVALPRPRSNESHYCQVTLPPEQPDLAPVVGWNPEYVERLLQQTVPPRIGAWTRDLLRRLKVWPAGGPGPQDDKVPPEDWARVAHALTDHLSTSGEFTYSLDLSRHDADLDPTEDFLLNVKQGHCSRFAAALALMLRSLGVPARVVKGYRGAESQGDGLYFVRFSQAHSWVEVLVPARGGGTWQWLTLDPTPPLPTTTAEAFSWARWLSDTWSSGQALWKNFILEYNSDQQGQSATQLWARLTGPATLRTLGSTLGVAILGVGTMLAVLGGGRLARRWWPRRKAAAPRQRPPARGSYARLLTVLARHCRLRPRPAQTPHEFATACQAHLGRWPETTALAALPLRVVELFYRARFGGQDVSEAERRAVEQDVVRLETALRARNSPQAAHAD
jgi:transglutaminase-like putative cysteine protease